MHLTLASIALIGLAALQEPTEPTPKPGDEGWLLRHQEEDGSWDADGFARHDRDGDPEGVAGAAEFDVAVTSLATLAMLGDSEPNGRYAAWFDRAIEWLSGQVQKDTGRVGAVQHALSLRHHAMATFALCETNQMDAVSGLFPECRATTEHILAARGDDGGWSASGEAGAPSDALTTGWCTLALLSARGAHVDVPDVILDDVSAWWERHMDAGTGIVSTTPRDPGGPPARLAPTAMGLLCRVLLGAKPEDHPELYHAANTLVASRPVWRDDGAGMDMETWTLTSFATYQLGGRHWKTWNKALKRDLVLSAGKRLRDPIPVGPHGAGGGSVASTAYMALTLEVYFRYSRLLTAR